MNTGTDYVLTLVRWYEWWFSKIQPLFLFIYLQIHYRLQDPSYSPFKAYLTTALLLFSGCSAAAYGHLVNDYFDRSADDQAGKGKLLTKFSEARRLALLILTSGLGVAPLLLLDDGRLVIGLLMIEYLVATLYSAPPFRVKERGILGIAFASLAQRAIPSLFINLGFMGSMARVSGAEAQLLVIGTLWTFMIGVRWIILHQLRDESNDQLSNVKTFVTSNGAGTAIALKTYLVIPLELILLCLTLTIMCRQAPLLIGVIGGYLLIVILRHKWRQKYPESQELLPFTPHILDNFYEVWLPLGFAVILTLHNPLYLGFVVMHVTLFNHNLMALIRKMRGRFQT
ncbi:MAG TPA: UbiA family prenyltransferase [Blastocatellia bacterium]|nr:UbiA family prenyltransferase [Blastocatellia bacterium]